MFPLEIAARGSFKRQIILIFVVGFFFLIAAFSAYLVKSERENLHRDSVEETMGLARSLAVSSLSWVLANDVVGLQEVVHSFRGYPELRYVMVISPTGRVLAHSDATKVGQFVSDERSLALIKAPPGNRVVTDNESIIDVAVPIEIDKRHVGWARVGLGREGIAGSLHEMIWKNVLFLLFATASSLLAAILIANRLGRRIGSLVKVAEEVQAGNFSTRASVPGGEDEIVKLANSLNQMLDALAQNEKRLRAASLYTRSLIEASLDPLVTISAEGKITDVNDATEKATGRRRSELIGTDFSDYFTEPERAREGYRRVFAKGLVTDYSLALRHRDGHVTDVLYNASVYRNEAGEVLGAFAAARDITERKRAEATRAQLAAMVESSDDAIIGKTLDNIITTWNHGAERMYGYTAQEAIGQAISLIVPEDKQEELQAFNERIKKGERVKHHETTRVAKDGRRIEVSLSLSPVLDDRGNMTRISAIARDITERKRDEALIRRNNQLLETVFSSIHVMIAYLDKDFNFIKVNRAYAAADQRTPDFFPGKNHFDLYPNEENKAIFQKVAETGEPAVYYAKPFEFAEHPERGISYWDWRLEPIAGADGKVEGLLFSLLNVTEQTLAAQKIRASAQYARSLIEASLDPLVTISNEGKITDVNTATEQVTGYSREKLIGTDFSDYFTEPEKAQQGYRQVFEKGFVRDYPLEIRHRDGNTPVLYNASVYKDEQGKVIGVFAAARDISERKRAEEALRENEHFLDSVIEHLPNMLFVKDAKNLNFVRFNEAGEKLLGYSRTDLIGKSDYDFFPKEQADFFISKDREIIASRELLDIHEEPISTRFSGTRYLHTRKIPVFADDGSPLYLLGISEDITERKQAEDALRKSEERLRLEAARMPIGYIIWDKDFRVVSWNPAAEKIFGFTFDEAKGRHPHETIVPPEAQAQVDDIWRRLLAGDASAHSVNENRTKGGRTIVCEWTNTPLKQPDGTILGVMSMVQDVTERIVAEEHLRHSEASLAEAQRMAHLGNWELDLVHNMLTWSEEIYRIFEIDPAQFGASYEAFLNAIHPDDREIVNKAYTESVRNKSPYDIVHRLLMKDGRVKYVNEKCETHYDADGKPLRSVGTVHDITAQKVTEIALTALKDDLENRVKARTAELESANKELEAFSYSVSHDLRTPLRAIDGFSRILLDDYTNKLDDEGKRLLNVVRDNTNRMSQLIDDILKFSRTGRLEIIFSEIDMEELAHTVFEELRPSIAAGGKLQLEIEPLPPAKGDRAMMRQVFVNLLSNAIKFSRAKETARIKVGGSIVGNEAVYFVQDNGVGFDMQYLDKLFGVFQRLHSVNEFEGTGIGLAIVKRIITRHGGRVWAEGKVNEGATIYFALPAKEASHG